MAPSTMDDMGQNNRQRRAAKQRQRATGQRPRTNSASSEETVGSGTRFEGLDEGLAAHAAGVLLSQALAQLLSDRPAVELDEFRAVAERHQQAAVHAQLTFALSQLIQGGWTPLDLYEVVRRKTESPAVAHLIDLVATATAAHPRHLVHPRWLAQLDQFGAADRDPGGRSPSYDWGRRHGLDWPATLEEILPVLVVICGLPEIDQVLPPPGSGTGSAVSAEGIDDKVLRRVRALLAKAESTEHPEEADALTAKAQELMTRHSIDRAVAESASPAGTAPVSRRLWIENPYVDAKALLMHAVADANNARAVQSKAWGYVALVGHAADLDVVELLVTSLLVQATRAMTQAGPQTTRSGYSRTRSFRQSFLVAYAGRIGERLHDSAHATEATYDGEHAGALVPVLTARREAVDDRVAELYPELVQRHISASDAVGLRAGRAAADRARFDVRAEVGPGPS